MTAQLGILMLDSRFPRVPGDIGNPETWQFPVRYRIVNGASPDAAVRHDPDALLHQFIESGRQLVRDGCHGITTSCGFLAPLRSRLADALGVPVAASALEQYGMLESMLPRAQKVGILTISRDSLGPAHLAAANIPENVAIAGLDGTLFAQSILEDLPHLDTEAAKRELIAAAKDLRNRNRDIGAILMECTNMAPYAAHVAEATGCPVATINTYLHWFYSTLKPDQY